MMKKIGICTINSLNYGNRLQNFAIQYVLQKYNFETTTIKNISLMNKKKNNFEYILRNIKHIIKKTECKDKRSRVISFKKFNKNIIFSKKTFNWFNTKWLTQYDYLIVGSDQVWNPGMGRLTDFDLLNIPNVKYKIAFAASFGVDNLSEKNKIKVKESLKKFKAISVREKSGKKIIESFSGLKSEVLIDPTMMLNVKVWDSISKKPKYINEKKKYILNYFLGSLSQERKKEIEMFAKKNNCEIINVLDKNSLFYECGPAEFLYLEKNAFLVCTDSFHSSVFSILFNTPFLLFDREDISKNMSSRIDTLLSTFKLYDRKYKGKIIKEDLICDYTKAYEILEKERKKADDFLKKALDIKESDINE